MQKEFLDQALYYRNCGLSTIPVAGKIPILSSWKELQERLPTEAELTEWFAEGQGVTGLAIVTGKLSGVVVLDLDIGADMTGFEIPETVSVQTGSGGRHYYFQYPDHEIITKSGILPKVDIRGEGGCAIMPPSLHASGKNYEWLFSFDRTKLAPMPQWLIDLLKKQKTKSKSKMDTDIVLGVGEGKRNQSAASIIGMLLGSFVEEAWEPMAWPLVQAWNARNTPPLPEDELRRTFDSIATRERAKRYNESLEEQIKMKRVEILLNMVFESEALLFHDQFQEPHIAVHGDGSKILKLNSKAFKRWLTHKAWVELGETFGGETVRAATQILEGKAVFEGEQHDLQVRVAKSNDAILYDFGSGKIAEITKEGWRILAKPPIAFRSLQHQKKQSEPIHGGNVTDLLSYMNIKRSEIDGDLGGDKLLMLVAIVAGFIPGFAHPVIVLYGPQGSAKTTLSRICKELLDPSALKTFTMPDNIREFVQLVSHHWFIPFDNLGQLNEIFSDALCRAVTGDGFSKRELYSDDDDIIYEFQRIIGLNGINLAVEKPDLLDRSIIIGLERVMNFEEEKSFWGRFRREKPALLGAIFDTLVLALKYIDKIPPLGSVRMADFMAWGCAITKALGLEPEDFLEAYESNVHRQNEEAIEASPVAMAIIDLLEKENCFWQGQPTELLTKFNTRAAILKIDTKLKSWPKDPRWLWRRIQEARTNLLANGITVERDRDKQRIITLRKAAKNVDDHVAHDTDQLQQPDLLSSAASSIDAHATNDVSKNSHKTPGLFGEG